MKKKILQLFFFILLLATAVFFFYCNNIKLVDVKSQGFYNDLKDSLEQSGFSTRLLVISAWRAGWHNSIQAKFSGAATNSKHLNGDAIDFLVFDINGDGNSDSKDVDIVFNILDKKIIKDKGGIGTYKNERNFINRQMIHIDCRGYRARWAR